MTNKIVYELWENNKEEILTKISMKYYKEEDHQKLFKKGLSISLKDFLKSNPDKMLKFIQTFLHEKQMELIRNYYTKKRQLNKFNKKGD